ncbi:hypothetical protein [Cytobacillus dafuensis]|uniref:Group-specific protein n=1 Tax=Cytobacillus dafuensis TaxID=1742359 RepID=A0A5B8Z5Y8_CYTDA|nr:hypothetical protein [Cytobacillus dafuensis]QED48348.1 hypothetical protein FSZ17_14490 [Cytobacillus dafuensis]
MFDPTAFENMKVVIEGALYDRDLDGELSIFDRNDYINAAKLSRRYEVSFTDQPNCQHDLYCTFIMEAGLENLAAELLQSAHSDKLAGCQIFVKVSFKHQYETSIFQKIEETLKAIWGEERSIKQLILSDPFSNQSLITNEVVVAFNRLVYEEQMNDIEAMIDYMTLSLKELRTVILTSK